MTERAKTVLAVYLILESEIGLLFLRRQNSGWYDGSYTVPAGHVDQGESASTAMVREAKEEIGITIFRDDLELVHVMHRNDHESYVDMYFRCRQWTGHPSIMEPNKADDIQWIDGGTLPNDVVPSVRRAVKAIRAGTTYSEDAWGST